MWCNFPLNFLTHLLFFSLTFLISTTPTTAIDTSTTSRNPNSTLPTYLSPNLYFVGFSKCGTTSMARLLVSHPLLVDVGDESYHPGSESHIFDHYSRNKLNAVQTERLYERLKTKEYSQDIISGHGVMMHYTPNYAGLKNIEDDIIRSTKENKKTSKYPKFLFMLRNPTARTASSWWYKNHCYKNPHQACPSFKAQIDSGITAVHKLVNCYTNANFTLEELVSGLRDGQRNLTKHQQHVLDSCPITLMAPPNSSLYGAHVGKSIYVYQLAHWFDRIRSSQIYLMFLENYNQNPVREVEMLFEWLGIETYGDKGFKDKETLFNLTQLQYNVHPIPLEIQKREIFPHKARLDEFYRPFIKSLQYLLRPLSSTLPEPTGNWTELVNEVLEQRLSTRNQKKQIG